MSDERLREAERRWRETGSSDDHAALLVERLRTGSLSRARVRLAATMRHEATLLVEPDARAIVWRRRPPPKVMSAAERERYNLLPFVAQAAEGQEPLMIDLAQLASAVFAALRRMDAEAATICAGKPTGLSSYGYHLQPTASKTQTEPAWSKRLAALLTEAGFPAKAECRYPCPPPPGRKRESCDVVMELSDGGGSLWLELKGAWRDYWAAKGGLLIYRSYLLHPLVPDLDEKSHTVPLDLEKLGRLSAPDAKAVAALLIGFETDDDPMDADVAELMQLAKLDQAPWSTFADCWAAHHQPGHSVRCWLWARAVTSATPCHAARRTEA